MEERITLDLKQNEVNVKVQKVIIVDGAYYPVGELQTTNYQNSIRGRKEIEKLEIKYVNAILAVWGNIPTVVEDITQ